MSESTPRTPGPGAPSRLLRQVVRVVLALTAAFVVGIAVVTWIGSDDLPVTPSPDPAQVVELVAGPDTGCGGLNAVWAASTRSGQVITICDLTGGAYGGPGRPLTSFEIGDRVAVGPGSFLQVLPGRVAVTFVSAVVAGALVWLATAMASRGPR